MIPVRCDYYEDLRCLLLTKLRSGGFRADQPEDVDTLLVRHLNLELRRIDPRPRTVQWSTELHAKKASIPTKTLRAIATIEAVSMKGDDLNPYLSRQLIRKRDADSHDAQLNDWGITHMHLSETFEAPGVIKSAKELLFVVVRDDTLYFIEVGEHGDWTDDKLFAILETNWPELLSHAVLEGFDGGFVPTPEMRARLHKKFVLATIGPSGRTYGPIGGGSATSGLNFRVRIEADRILNRLHEVESAHKAQGVEIAAKIASKCRGPLTELHLKLHSIARDGEVVVVETQTNIRISSSLIAQCTRCGQALQGTRDAILAAGWKKPDTTSPWLCAACI